MSGTEGQASTFHFIILGNSKEHILKAIDHFHIDDMVIFTSDELMEMNQSFIRDLKNQGITIHEIIPLKPFEDDSLRIMTIEMLKAYERYSPVSSINVITALTGGTNLMVIAMGLVALLKGLKCHYIVKNEEHKILEIDLLQELSGLRTLDGINSYLMEGCL